MVIEGNYIKLDKAEYLATLGHLNAIVREKPRPFGGSIHYMDAAYYEKYGQLSKIDWTDCVLAVWSKLKLAKRFDLAEVLIETDQGEAWRAAVEVLFEWK